ncbi:Protein sof1 [Lecanora helva]
MGKGHVDGVYSLAKDPDSLERFASGSGDGVVKIAEALHLTFAPNRDLTNRDEVWQNQAHEGIIKGLSWTKDRKLITCASDKSIKVFDPYGTSPGSLPLATYLGNTAYTGVSHHRFMPNFAVSSNVISIYDLSRPSGNALQTLQWPTSDNTINALSFNQVETSIIASCATDRSIIMFDLRTASPLYKTTLNMSSNAISWNPMEAFNFCVANEDHNIYMFDMRKMNRALNVFRDHVAAVMDVEFSPHGEELVTASYDRTVRLWNRNTGHSRDIYHTKRMQRVFSCKWTPDAQYILSGSDDGNVRLWRAQASKREGIKSARQRQKLEYDETLQRRYGHMPEIRRIKRHRHVPKTVKKAGEIKAEELAALKRRRENERKHSKKGLVPRKPEREKMILATET